MKLSFLELPPGERQLSEKRGTIPERNGLLGLLGEIAVVLFNTDTWRATDHRINRVNPEAE